MSASSETAVSAPPSAEPEPPWLLRAAKRRGLLVGGLILLALFFLLASDQWLTIANYTMLAAIAALSLNVLSGYAGQISLGVAFFMAVGAYTAEWLGGDPTATLFLGGKQVPAIGMGLSILIWLPASGIAAAIAGAVIGPTALRLKGFYLGIVTLALIFIGQHIMVNAVLLTGGPGGRTFPSPVFGSLDLTQQNNYFGIAVTEQQQFFVVLLVILALAAVFVHNVMRSRAGRAFQAVRDNEVGASIMGVNLLQAKMGAFILSSFLAGIAGALYASYVSYVRPDYWGLILSIQFVAAIIIGGVASVWGSILGAAFVFALPQILNQFSPAQTTGNLGFFGIAIGDLNAAIYGLLIILFLLFEPGGFLGLIRRIQLLVRRLSNRTSKGGEAVGSHFEPDPPFEVESSALSSDDGTEPLVG